MLYRDLSVIGKLVQYLNRSCGACVWPVELVTILGMVTVLGTVTIQQWLQFWRWQSRNGDSPRDRNYQRDYNYYRDGDHPRDGDHLKDGDCLRSGDCPRDDEYSNYGWSCRLHPLKFKEYYLMVMSEIWDRQTDTTMYRVAPQLKISRLLDYDRCLRLDKPPFLGGGGIHSGIFRGAQSHIFMFRGCHDETE